MRVERGETLLLFTDGVEDARDADGTHFALDGILGELLAGGVPPAPAELVAGVRAAVLRHTRGHFTDDVALLAIRNDRPALLGSPPAPVAVDSRPVPVPRPRQDV
jgi:serine phosphatase RsbU (regulator of sigma subunit)